MVNLYLFHGSNINFFNILQDCFMISRKDLYDPCRPILQDGLLTWDISPFINDIGGGDTFRIANWAEHTQPIDFLVKNNLTRAYATYRQDQIIFLKKYLNNRCVTVGIHYDHNDYNFVLESFVKIHLHRQQQGLVDVTEYDQQLRKSGIDLLDHYKTSFAQQNLVSQCLPNCCDYSVPVMDLFDRNKLFKHLIQLDAIPNNKTIEFYNSWQESFDSIMSL